MSSLFLKSTVVMKMKVLVFVRFRVRNLGKTELILLLLILGMLVREIVRDSIREGYSHKMKL